MDRNFIVTVHVKNGINEFLEKKTEDGGMDVGRHHAKRLMVQSSACHWRNSSQEMDGLIRNPAL